MSTYDRNADVQDNMAGHLVDLVRHVPSGRVMEIGCGTGLMTRRLVSDLHPERLWLNDLCPSAEMFVADMLGTGVEFIAGDAESIVFPGGLDMIVSSATVQWFDDLKAFFAKCSDALTDGGVLAFSTFGKDNLKEIQAVEGRGLEYYGKDELVESLESMFDVAVAEECDVRMDFHSPLDVVRHLKETGVTGLGKEKWTRGKLMSFSRRYEELFSDGMSVPLTYNPIWIVARKR